ncbi:D-glucuronyl C5-epimerase family protein (plasmid) [Shimia sp. W99]
MYGLVRMTSPSRIRMLAGHLRHQSRLKIADWRDTEHKRPLRHPAWHWQDIGGARVISRSYPLFPDVVHGQHPRIPAPKNWCPRPDLELDNALPFGWDPIYHTHFIQPFQPVKLWRNTIAICGYIEDAKTPSDKNLGLSLLNQLFERMRAFTVWQDEAAFIENRFEYRSDRFTIPAPWVSAIANAFAILACLRALPHLDLRSEMAAYAQAYRVVQLEGRSPLPRWISYRDRRGYLWFDEYPQPRARATRVKNGHIFSVLALHEASLFLPGLGLEVLVQAGAATIEDYALCFRRPNKRSLYALGRRRKPDYLPNRAMRQLYQLYQLTGEPRFLAYGDLFVADAERLVDDDLMQPVHATRSETTRLRQAFEQARSELNSVENPHRQSATPRHGQ